MSFLILYGSVTSDPNVWEHLMCKSQVKHILLQTQHGGKRATKYITRCRAQFLCGRIWVLLIKKKRYWFFWWRIFCECTNDKKIKIKKLEKPGVRHLLRKREKSVHLPYLVNPTIVSTSTPVFFCFSFTSQMTGIIKLIPGPFSVAGLQPKEAVRIRERGCAAYRWAS